MYHVTAVTAWALVALLFLNTELVQSQDRLDNMDVNPLDPQFRNMLSVAKKKYGSFLNHQTVNSGKFPIYGYTSYKVWETAGGSDPNSGYYPGILWRLYRLTNDRVWSEYAAKAQEHLKNHLKDRCDTAYKIVVSYGLGIESGIGIEKQLSWKQVVIDAANNYIKEAYNDANQLLKGRECKDGDDVVDCSSITDVQILFEAGSFARNDSYFKFGNQQATKLTQCLRPDGSVMNALKFNKAGKVVEEINWHGAAVGSAWAQLQARMILGFSRLYELTGNKRYLNAARKAGEYFSRSLPPGGIPYWDFSAATYTDKANYLYHDSTAATIASVGLLKLYYSTGKGKYRTTSERMIEAVMKRCSAEKFPVPAMLINATRFWSNRFERNVATTWGDFHLLWYAEEYQSLSKMSGNSRKQPSPVSEEEEWLDTYSLMKGKGGGGGAPGGHDEDYFDQYLDCNDDLQ